MINYYEKSVGNMCLFVSKKSDSARNVERARESVHQFYLTTLDRFKDGISPRIWLKVGILLAHMYLALNRPVPLAKLLPRLHLAVRGKDGRDDPIKAVQVLEILSIEIQMLTFRRHHKRLKVRARLCRRAHAHLAIATVPSRPCRRDADAAPKGHWHHQRMRSQDASAREWV
jgi:hypothetical protein